MLWLITGAKGFVGRNLVSKLRSEREDVIAIGRGEDIPRTCFDVVVNCAGEIHQPNLSKLFESNVAFASNLMTYAKYDHFIQVGSSSEYGESKNFSICPNTAYSISKCSASILAKQLGHSVIRPYSLYGPWDRSTKFIPVLLRDLTLGNKIPIYPGDHDWVYIDDFVNAVIHMGRLGIRGTFDMCTGVAATNFEVASSLKNILNSESKFNKVKSSFRVYDRVGWVGDIERNVPGILPITKLTEGLYKCAQSYKKEF